MMDMGASFGQWVARRRKALRLSQSALAKQANCAPITIRKIEEDARRPSRQLAEGLAKLLAVLPSELDVFIQVARGECGVHHLSASDQLKGAQLLALFGTEHAADPSNLPVPTTPLIGRAQAAARATDILRQPDTRLLTLIGTPGIGKTRLALQVAANLGDAGSFLDGVCFVPLASVDDAEFVANVMAQSLGVSLISGTPALESVKQHLRGKALLLVLDNFEHVLNAAVDVSELISVAPDVKVLVTSRAALRLSGEHLFEVAALALPPIMPSPKSVADVAGYSAIQLFVQRARALMPSFALTADNSAAVTEICRRLDGLPLAIELAAARIRLLNPPAMLARLNLSVNGKPPQGALELLIDGPRDLPPRQRTLRHAIAWSYALLTPSQQHLLRSLSVFAGGCTLEAALAVGAHMPGYASSLLTDLQALLDNSLIQRSDLNPSSDSEPRYSMLEMIREFALEQITLNGEADAAHRRHAAYFEALINREPSDDGVDPARPGVWSGLITPMRTNHFVEGAAMRQRLTPEEANLRAALVWSLSEGQAPQIGMEIVIGLFFYWRAAGHSSEAIEWIDRALAGLSPETFTRERGRLLCARGVFCGFLGDFAVAQALVCEALTIHRALADDMDMICTLMNLAEIYVDQNQLLKALEALTALRETALPMRKNRFAGWAIYRMGEIAFMQGRLEDALEQMKHGLALYGREDERDIVHSFIQLGRIACIQGRYDDAEALIHKSLVMWQSHEFKSGMARAYFELGNVALCRGDVPQAHALFEESLSLYQEIGSKSSMADCMAGLAAVAAAQGQLQHAVTVWAAVEAALAHLNQPRTSLHHERYRAQVDIARQRLDEVPALAALEGDGRCCWVVLLSMSCTTLLGMRPVIERKD